MGSIIMRMKRVECVIKCNFDSIKIRFKMAVIQHVRSLPNLESITAISQEFQEFEISFTTLCNFSFKTLRFFFCLFLSLSLFLLLLFVTLCWHIFKQVLSSRESATTGSDCCEPVTTPMNSVRFSTLKLNMEFSPSPTGSVHCNESSRQLNQQILINCSRETNEHREEVGFGLMGGELMQTCRAPLNNIHGNLFDE